MDGGHSFVDDQDLDGRALVLDAQAGGLRLTGIAQATGVRDHDVAWQEVVGFGTAGLQLRGEDADEHVHAPLEAVHGVRACLGLGAEAGPTHAGEFARTPTQTDKRSGFTIETALVHDEDVVAALRGRVGAGRPRGVHVDAEAELVVVTGDATELHRDVGVLPQEAEGLVGLRGVGCGSDRSLGLQDGYQSRGVRHRLRCRPLHRADQAHELTTFTRVKKPGLVVGGLTPLDGERLHLVHVVNLREGDLVIPVVLVNQNTAEDKVDTDVPVTKADLAPDVLELQGEGAPFELVAAADHVVDVHP